MKIFITLVGLILSLGAIHAQSAQAFGRCFGGCFLQRQDKTFAKGDEVQFYLPGTDKVVDGSVMELLGTGACRVKYLQPELQVEVTTVVSSRRLWKKGETPAERPPGYNSEGAGKGGDSAESNKPKPIRTWKAATGHKIVARLVALEGETVKLQKEDGTPVSIALNKLSLTDVNYVKNIGQNNLERRKITEKPEIPFSSNRLKLSGGRWEFKHDPSVETNYSLGLETVLMSDPVGFGSNNRSRNRWSSRGRSGRTSGRFGRGTAGETSSWRDKKLDYEFGQWTMAQDGKRCFMIANSKFDQGCLIQGMNFETGELEFSEKIDGQGIAISPDGRLVALLQTPRSNSRRGELIIKETGEGGAVLQRHTVKAFSDKSGYAPQAGYFMNNSTLVTVGRRIVAINLDRKTGYCTTPFPKNAWLVDSALSPNRKHVALLSPGGIFIYDVSRGKPIGTIVFSDPDDSLDGMSSIDSSRIDTTRIGQMAVGRITFSGDGSKLAFCSAANSSITIYDLATGKVKRELPSHGIQVVKSVSWPSPRFLLLDNTHLFDLKLGVSVWKFKTEGSFFNPLFHMGQNTYLNNDGERGLTPISLPLERIAGEADELEIEDSIVLKEGDDYRLEMDTGFARSDLTKIEEHFEKQLGKRGITYNEESKNVFYLTVTESDEESAIIEMGNDQTTTVRYTPTTCKVELEIEGDLKWEVVRENTFSGGALVGQQNESPQQAIERICKPKLTTFSGLQFPSRFVLFPNGSDVLGESTISSDGVEDVDD
ncbi:MAG: SHD1 domain-containing protein [Mariniblastus sp.]